MRTNVWRLTSVLIMLAMLISPVGSALAAPINTQPAAPQKGMQIIDASFVGVSQPLSSLIPLKSEPNAATLSLSPKERLGLPKAENALSKSSFDPSIVQNGPVGDSMPAPIANFEGVNNISGVYPPDTQGDIGYDPGTGKKYYIQWVNLNFQIWDVTNPAAPVSVYGPAAGNTLWSGTGTLCASHNDGDPITQFDPLANRWMMSQFALSFPNNFHQCIAVSATSDPTGPWYRYDFQTSTTKMNDYPHFGVWPDGYYMTVNQFDGTTEAWAGAGVAAFDRVSMLAGLPAQMIYIDTGAVTLNYGGMLPSDLDGTAPAVGTPNYFMEWDDSSWLGDPTDTLRIWEFHTDWTTPTNSTFGLNTNYDPNLKIATADVDPNMCAGARNCVPQPGTTAKLDAIADRLMYRLQYRNFGTYQTIVGNHTVDSNGSDLAGIHWFELRDPGTGFAMHQQGVYTSGTDNAWMGSAAMDYSGDIALGYSVSSGATYPSIRYTGRLAGDPAGTLPQGESTLIAGTGSQTGTGYRWGDYSMMAVDAQDECTFWYTQEYYATTSSAGWQTRIGSFKFPSCSTAPTGTISGTVTSGATPLVGATVEATGGYTTVTDAAGHYDLILVAGTYSVTASKYGYIPSTVPDLVVTPPGATTQDFDLAVAPTSTITGVVTDATTGWPLYAKIDIAGYPGGSVFTDPVTGAYSVDLVDSSYTFTVTAMSGGYTPDVLPIVVSGNATQDFDLDVDLLACNAVGYASVPGTVLSSDGFDTSTAPAFSANWVKVDTSGTAGDWVTRTASVHPAGISPHNTPNMAVFNSYTASAGNATIIYQLAGADLSAQSGAEVSFWMYHESQYSGDKVQVYVSSNGSTFYSQGAAVYVNNGTTGWAKHTININAYTGVGMNNVRVAFMGISNWGNDIHIDDLAVSTAATCVPLASGGLVVGSVFDANTGLLIPGASVQDAALNSALMIDASADPATPDEMYVIAETAGVQALTASAPIYADETLSPTVVSGGTVKQDFYLAAGYLSTDPTSLAFDVYTTSPTLSKPLALNNTGGALANYNVYAIAGTFPGYTPTGPFADHTRHFGPKNLNDKDASAIRQLPEHPFTPPLAAGNVTASWPTGLAMAWGIGFNTDATDLWLGNPAGWGGDNFDYRFTTAGVNTGDKIDVTPFVPSGSAADMTYNPFTKTLWQVRVGGDNCIYELDPVAKVATGNKICPPFGTNERGLAFDPVSYSYYAGSWNDGIINHFAPDGTLLDSKNVALLISGLAYNPSTKHLFVLSNTDSTTTPTHYDVTVLDTAAAYAVVGGFNLMNGGVKAFADYAQAGLELDCNGNLWAVDQTAKKVYAADSGETGVCDWKAPWLSVAPASGSVAATSAAGLTVSVDATGKAVGTYPAFLRVMDDTPYADVIVPVTLGVTIDPIAHMQVLIAGLSKGIYDLPLGESTRQNYTAVNDGPVKVVSTGAPLLAAQRILYTGYGTQPTSFVEMMGLPDGQLDTTYWFPWYKNAGEVDTQIRIGNVSTSTATVHIYVAGVEVTGSPFTLTTSGAGQSQRLSFDLNNGPVKIVSDQKIVATERLIYFTTGGPTSFSEMMGLPDSQLSKTYWFPWYKNAGEVDTQIRIGNVSPAAATVHIYIAGVEVAGSPFTLTTTGAGQSQRLNFAGVNDGPVKIVSDQNIVASQRLLYYAGGLPTSFVETMGIPDVQLGKTQWFPWYKNDGIVDTQLRIGNVSGLTATVHVYIAGVEVTGSPFTLTATGAGQSQRLSFPGTNNGAVKIVSDQNVIASERLIYFLSGVPISFSEMMGTPDSLLSPTYWLPWYKNIGEIDTQLRFGAP